jgi:hypothetical protein
VSAFDDEFGLFGETVVDDVERQPTRREEPPPREQPLPREQPPQRSVGGSPPRD